MKVSFAIIGEDYDVSVPWHWYRINTHALVFFIYQEIAPSRVSWVLSILLTRISRRFFAFSIKELSESKVPE